MRLWVMQRLGLRSEAAADGEWWEVDLILVVLFGAFLAAGIALFGG